MQFKKEDNYGSMSLIGDLETGEGKVDPYTVMKKCSETNR